MKQLRWWFIAMLCWSFLVYNLERIHEPLNIASFVYVFVAVIASLVVAAPRRANRYFGPIMVCAAIVFLTLKGYLGYPVMGAGLPLTVMELVVIGVTSAIARQTALCIANFENAANSAMLASLAVDHEHAALEDDMYREVRRARQHGRPLSLVAIGPRADDLSECLEQFLEELQQRNLRQLALAKIGDSIARNARECDLISPINGGYLLLLPELAAEAAREHVQSIVARIETEMGLELQHSAAEFPNQETTFSGLLERVEADLREKLREGRRLDQNQEATLAEPVTAS